MTDTTVPTQTNVEVPQIDTAKIAEEASRLTAEQLESTINERITEATQKARQEAEQAIVERIAGKKEPERWQPKSYDEIVERAKAETTAEIEKRQKEQAEAQKKQFEESEKQKQERVESMKKTWDEQISRLEETGLPKLEESIAKKIQNGEKLSEQELADPAVQARRQLYSIASENKEPNLELVYYKYMQGRTNIGANAPVGGARKSVTPQNDTPFTYEEIHNTPLEDITKQMLGEQT